MHGRNTNGIYATEDHPYVWAAPFESRRRTLMGFICLGEYREGAVLEKFNLSQWELWQYHGADM